MNDRAVSKAGVVIRRRSGLYTRATISPTTTPPPAARRKLTPTCSTVTVPATAAMAVRNAVSAVASLTRLSPSSTWTTAKGIPTRRAIAVAATASGGATTAPRAKPAASGMSGISHHATSPTIRVVKITRPTDSEAMVPFFARKSMNEVLYAALKSSGGRMPTSTSSGSSATSGRKGTKDAAIPTSTRSRGADVCQRSARAATATTQRTITTSHSAISTVPPRRATRDQWLEVSARTADRGGGWSGVTRM